jgi:hypothetical protein
MGAALPAIPVIAISVLSCLIVVYLEMKCPPVQSHCPVRFISEAEKLTSARLGALHPFLV